MGVNDVELMNQQQFSERPVLLVFCALLKEHLAFMKVVILSGETDKLPSYTQINLLMSICLSDDLVSVPYCLYFVHLQMSVPLL